MNENENLTPVKELTPFTRMIMTIGTLPTSFYASMSYYESMVWLYEYLKNEVIPTVNNNAEAVEELQQAYIELHDYIEHYFDNLDVQEEINNKLNEMAEDGSLTNLIKNYVDPIYQTYENSIDAKIEEQDGEIETFKTSINSQIAVINNKVDNVANGSPLVASSTSEMTDTSRVYVNTTDGKWYYYDGDSWEIGGTYQTSGIANGSIDILKLDNNLQKNFFINYGEPLDLGSSIAGYYQNNGTLVTSGVTNIHYDYSLENGKTYIITCENGVLLAGLVIEDNSHNIVYGSNPTGTAGNFVYIFKVNQNNLTAHISLQTDTHTDRLPYLTRGTLRELTNIYNQLRYSEIIPTYKELNNSFTKASDTASNIISFGTLSSYNVKIYQATKGRKYYIHGYNKSNIATCVIADLYNTLIYTSSTENVGNNNWVEFNKTYDCEDDGYIIITEFSDSTHDPASIEIINAGIDINNVINPLINKKLGADGDSIMAGAGNDYTGYAEMIATNNSMTIQNRAVGGGTIATGTYSGETPRHWICESVSNLDTDCDIVLVNGGINDWNQSVPLGEYTPSYTAVVDSTTFYGGLETLCRNLLIRFSTNKKIYFVTNHNVLDIMTTIKPSGLTFASYLEATYKVMNKYGIEIIDIGKNTHFNTGIDYYKNNYTGSSDGIHPNQNGYNYFYVPYIEGILKQELKN